MSDVHAAEAATNDAVHTEPNETEVKARRLGWVPKDEFRGDADRWRPADEFLSRGEQLLPILKRDNDKLHQKFSVLESELKETKQAAKELLEFTSKSEQRAYERARAEIQTRIEQAAANADPAAARAAMAEYESLKPEAPKPAQTEAPRPQVDPEIQDWIGREDWFNKDRTLNVYATDLYGELERQHPGMSVADKLAETKKRTVEKFPEKFGINPAREGAAAVASPSGQTVQTKKRGKTYDDLPADAKRACDRFVKTMKGYTREQYVKDYDWDS